MVQHIPNEGTRKMWCGYDWVDRRVFDQVFDRLTLMALYKMMKSGVIDTLDFPVARGKEAHVFHGTNLAGEPVAVKIFHTSNAVFKNLIQYIEGDPRFTGLRRKHRDLVEVWVRKEYRNLNRLARWGLNVPHPHGYQDTGFMVAGQGMSNGADPCRANGWMGNRRPAPGAIIRHHE